MLIAVSGNFGFLAPVSAAQSPATIDAINRYPPEGALNAMAFAGFVVDFVIFGMAMAKTVGFPRPSGVLVAIGAPCQVVGSLLNRPGIPGGSIAWKGRWSHGKQQRNPPVPAALPARAA
jgi:hypothetical protein